MKELKSRYKVGDKVRVIDNDWCDFIGDMKQFIGKIVTISEVNEEAGDRVEYDIVEDGGWCYWIDDCFQPTDEQEIIELVSSNKAMISSIMN